MWRPKQNIIDLEDYLSKPIVSCPMQIFPHFHWIAIEGKRPNIPENFIREEFKIINDLKEKESRILPTEINVNQQININSQISQINLINLNNSINQRSQIKVVPPVIHNISKELQIFLENFEQRFRKEIKTSNLNPLPIFNFSNELEISLNVIENEPGVVELLPYIIEFLMKTLSNKQHLKDPKLHMLILHYMNSILNNSYFYIEPYVHQIVTLILSLILMENSLVDIDLSINVKDYAIKILKTIFNKFEIKYPKFINQLLDIFEENLVPSNDNPSYLTTYGAIKSINTLGPIYILNIILPNLDKILAATNREIILNDSKILDKPETLNEKCLNPSQLSPAMVVDQPSQIYGSYQKITFSLPPFQSNPPINPSIFSEISYTNVINEQKESKWPKEDVQTINKNLFKNKSFSIQKYHKAFYVHYAIKESAALLLNYANSLDHKQANYIFEKLFDLFGECLLPNLLNQNNISADVLLDSYI